MIPPALLIHTCTIVSQTATGQTDDFGVPAVSTTTTQNVKCRFVAPKGGIKILESGEHVTALPGVLFPPGTPIAERDTVSTGPVGFDKIYTVAAVKVIYGPTSISHLKAELEAVT